MYLEREKINSLILWTGIIITYLFVEWIYNQHLLEVLLREKISPQAFENTEIFGKIIASFGINFFFYKLFKYSYKYFLVGIVVTYFLLTSLFTYAINSFSDEFRHSSYYSMLYRSEVLQNKDKNNLLNNSSVAYHWYEKGLLMSYFVFTLKENDWKSYEQSVKTPIEKEINKQKNDFNQMWQQYQNVSLLKKKLDKGYEGYTKLMAKYNSYRYGSYKNVALKKFLKHSGGLPPDLTQEEFFKKAPGAKIYNDFINKTFYKGSSDFLTSPIYGKDITLHLKKSEFKKYMETLLNDKLTQLAPNVNNIRVNTQSETPVAVLIIPPVSIFLSLVSIILNLFLLVVSWIIIIPAFENHSKKIIGGLLLIYTLGFALFITQNDSLLIKNQQFNSMEQKAQKDYPLLSYFWKFSLHIEPLICFKEKPVYITKLTNVLYSN